MPRIASGFVCTLILASVSLAQTAGTATMAGTVTDTAGAVLVGAKVSVVNIETAFVSDTLTNPEGSYYVPYLAPGTYRLTIEVPGFKRYVRDAIVLRTGETPRLDVQLELGAVTESVQVSGTAPLLD